MRTCFLLMRRNVRASFQSIVFIIINRMCSIDTNLSVLLRVKEIVLVNGAINSDVFCADHSYFELL